VVDAAASVVLGAPAGDVGSMEAVGTQAWPWTWMRTDNVGGDGTGVAAQKRAGAQKRTKRAQVLGTYAEGSAGERCRNWEEHSGAG
jgi:hypothetical protein